MVEEVHNPVRDYREIYRDRFIAAAERAFMQFANSVYIDIAANRHTCQAIRNTQEMSRKVQTAHTWWWVLCIALWVMAVASFGLKIWCDVNIVVPIVIAVAIAIVQIAFVHRHISKLSKQKKELKNRIDDLIAQAYAQMAPLNSLYDEDIFRRLVHEVLPIVTLDPYLRASDMQIFAEEFGWMPDNDNTSSTTNVQSGKINGNPFIVCRRLVHTMGTKRYTGSKVVTVRKTRVVNGKTERYTSSETLYAHVTKPFPEYTRHTDVIYGNQAAPELAFSRKKNTFKNKEGSISYRWAQHKLKKKAARMDQDFAMMTNEEFEVLFTTMDRNNNHQYALLFTPVAQANMIELIRDEEVGYGDDFCFYKNGRINTIVADHMQVYDLDWSPSRLCQYEYDRAQEVFVGINLEAFRGLYFALAPLLSIPLYQQMRPGDDVRAYRDQDYHSHQLQHEMLAYFWGQDMFRHSDCATDCILKTHPQYMQDGSTQVNVISYGYRSVPRVDYVTVRASDGQLHSVPVHWDEYIPIQGSGSFRMIETDDAPEGLTPQERVAFNADKLRQTSAAYIFKHIATTFLNKD